MTWRFSFPPAGAGRQKQPWILLVPAVVAVAALIFVELSGTAPYAAGRVPRLKVQAAQVMARGIEVLARERSRTGAGIDPATDPNGTGLIGPEFTPLVTTLGPLEVKRTTTNPAFAALIVEFLVDLGVGKGDVVAAGISGSFPALALALYAAAEVLEAEVIAISSIGASTYGATDPEFTWLDMERLLQKAGVLRTRSSAASPGGDEDLLENPLFPEAAWLARAAIRRNQVVLLESSGFREAVNARLGLYETLAAGRPIAAYVNIGGAETSLGRDNGGQGIPAGIVRRLPAVPERSKGTIHAMVEAGIPAVNLLNVRELSLIHGLPFDPIPLPPVGTGETYAGGTSRVPAAIALAVVLAATGISAAWGRSRERVQ